MLPEFVMAGKAQAMAVKFPDCLYFVPNHVDSFRYVLHLPDCLYLVSKHVYSFRNILHLPDCLYLVPNYVYSLRNILHLPYCLYFSCYHLCFSAVARAFPAITNSGIMYDLDNVPDKVSAPILTLEHNNKHCDHLYDLDNVPDKERCF